MDKKFIIGIIVILILIAGAFLLTGSRQEPVVNDKSMTINEAKEIAEDWITDNAPTYVFDGFDLAIEDQNELVKGEAFYFAFSFNSRMAGYGDRADEMAAQVITPHIMQIIVENGRIAEAITDGVYDEIKDEMLEGTLPETMKIKLYFVQIIGNQEEIVEVERSIPYTIAIAGAAIEELLKGPLPHEKAEGMSSAINEGTALQSINIQDGVAFVDFNERLQESIAGSAWVMAIRSQIEKTLMQFDTVEEVIISIDGRTEDILQP